MSILFSSSYKRCCTKMSNKRTSLRDLIGLIKDKASQTKSTIFPGSSSSSCSSSNPKDAISLDLTILKSTTHSPNTPPSETRISALLAYGHGSRATAATLVESLMTRLHRTSDAAVSLKCLIVVHNLINRGSFIVQDQLSIFPTFGGRNYLNLSNFLDSSTPAAWILSSWIRWYANYLEHLLSTSRTLGVFISSSSSKHEKTAKGSLITSLMNKDLLREIGSLINLVQEICKIPDSCFHETSTATGGNRLVLEVVKLVGDDYISIFDEIFPRIDEFKFKERLSCLTFGDSVELVCELKRLEYCKERIATIFGGNEVCKDKMVIWDLVGDIKDMIGMDDNGYNDGMVMRRKGERRGTLSESARFNDQVLCSCDPVKFSSGRFDKFQIQIRRV